MNKFTSICVGVLALTTFANAQNLTAHSSTQNFNYVYGAGGDGHVDNISETRTNLIATDTMHHDYAGDTAGVLPGGTAYSAGVGVTQDQTYTITGSLSNFTQISVDSSATALAASTGAGTAQLLASNPGNEVIFEFTLAADKAYHFYGSIDSSPDEVGAGNFIALQRFDGIVWQQFHNTLFLPGMQGSFDYSGTLTAGQYRLHSTNSLNVFGNENVASTLNYDLEVVPEPVTMFAIAPALLFLARKRKKS